MGILDRFTSIVKANINELLDKAEDPEKMVDQYLREMTESLAEVREATAGVMAEEKRCKKLLDENREETEKYEELARKALAAGNEADARVFLAKKQELAGRAEGLTVAYEGAKANADKMRQMHDKLVADIEELNARKATIKAKAAVAKTQSKVNEMTSAGDRAEGARSAFDRMEAKADEMLDRANAVAELSEKPADPTEELAKKYALADYTMFIGSGALWGETILYSMCLLEEMQWKRIRHITSHDFFHGTLELLEPGVPVFLFMGEDECRALDERVRAFLTSGVTGDEDYVIIDTAEYAIPGLDDDFRVIVSPWILSVLTTDRLSRNYELVTKHNLKYRRYYHQFDY